MHVKQNLFTVWFLRSTAVLFILSSLAYSVFRYQLARAASVSNRLIQDQSYGFALAVAWPYYTRFPWYSPIGHTCGQALMGLEQYDNALKVLDETRRYTFDYTINLKIGICLEKLHRWEDAFNEYEYVLDYATRNQLAKDGIIRSGGHIAINQIMQIGEHPDPIQLNQLKKFIEGMITKYKPNENLAESLMIVFFLNNDLEQLIQYKEKPKFHRIANKWIAFMTLKKEVKSKHWKKVFRICKKMLDEKNANPTTFLRLYYELKDVQPEDTVWQSQYLFVLGRLYLGGGNFAEAKKCFSKASLENPHDKEILKWLSIAEEQTIEVTKE